MQESNATNPVIQSVSNSVPVVEQPKQSNFLVVLLSILLITSLAIAGFFAFQTQKLVKELTLLRSEPTPMATVEPTTEPVATSSVISASDIPVSINKLYTAINSNFKISLVPVAENQFYSPTGMVTKKSWKLDLLNNPKVDGKAFAIFINSQLTSNDAESGGIGGGGIDAYENSSIKCLHSYMSQGPDIHNYLSCAEK